MKKTLIFFLTVFFFACNGKVSNDEHEKQMKQEEVKHIKIFNDSMKKLCFQSIRLVPLETKDNILLGGELQLKIVNNEFFLLDMQNQKCVLRFDSEGKFLNKIGKYGRGPQEYNPLGDFSIHGDTIDFLSGSQKPTIIGYRRNGNFLYSKTFDIYSLVFEKIKSGYVFYRGYGRFSSSTSLFRINITDDNGNIQSSYLKDDTQLEIPVMENNFSRFDNLIYFHEAFNNSVYVLNSGILEKTYTLDFETYSIPDAFYKTGMKGFEMLHKNGFATIKNYFGNNKMDFFVFVVQKKGQETQVHYVLYDLKHNRMYRKTLDEESGPNSPFNQPISITKNNELVFLSPAYAIIDNRESLKDVATNNAIIDGLSALDNPVVLFCQVKK
jgi:hypothetical protein